MTSKDWLPVILIFGGAMVILGLIGGGIGYLVLKRNPQPGAARVIGIIILIVAGLWTLGSGFCSLAMLAN
jgi:hypothetical protein